MGIKTVIPLFAIIGLTVILGNLLVKGNYLLPLLISAFFILTVIFAVIVQVIKRNRKLPQLSHMPISWYETVVMPHSLRFLRHQQMTFAISLGVILLALNLYAPAGPTLIQRLLASLIIVFASVLVWLWLSSRDRGGVPFLPFFAIIYAVHYALPIFWAEDYTRVIYIKRVVPDYFINQALMFSLISLALVLVGYYGFHQRAVARIVPKFNMQWKNYNRLKWFGITLGILGISSYYLKILFSFPPAIQQTINFLSDFSLISVIILTILQLMGRLDTFGMGFLWAFLVPSKILLGLGTGAAFQGIEVVLILLVTYASLKHRMPWKLLAIGFILVILVRPVMTEFRTLIWWGEMADRPHTEKVALFLKIAQGHFTGETLPYYDSIQLTMSRLNMLMTFAEVIESTPDNVPFWKGETYYPLLFTPIPRFLYPDKPIEMTGQTFGHRYGFLSSGDFGTAYNLPQLVELYGNFGVIGVLLGSFFIGTLYRAVQHFFIHRKMGFGAVVAGIYIFSKLLTIESSAHIVFGGLFWSIIYLSVINLVMKASEKSIA